MERHRKLIESIRLYGSFTLGILIAFQWVNLIAGISIVLALGLIDLIFIKPKLKANR
jgi:hypothetical protein